MEKLFAWVTKSVDVPVWFIGIILVIILLSKCKRVRFWWRKLELAQRIDVFLTIFTTSICICCALIDLFSDLLPDSVDINSLVLAELCLIAGTGLFERCYLFEDLRKIQNQTNNVRLSTKGKIDDSKKLAQIFENAKNVYVLGIANDSKFEFSNFNRDFEPLFDNDKVKNVHFVCMDPTWESTFDILKYKTKNKPTSKVKNSITAAVDTYVGHKKDDKDNRYNKMMLKVIRIDIPFSMIWVQYDDHDYIEVFLHCIDAPDKERRSFVLDEKDWENLKFYQKQWENIWENQAKELSIGEYEKWKNENDPEKNAQEEILEL